MVDASLLEAHPGNFRVHTPEQRSAMDAVLGEVGFAGAVLVRELEGGRYQILDGHLRVEEMAGQQVPVLVTDLDETEAKKVLATFDAVGSMAEVDDAGLKALIEGIECENKEIDKIIAEMVETDIDAYRDAATVTNPISLTEMKTRKVDRVWILIGIPQGNYQLSQPIVDELRRKDGVVSYTTTESRMDQTDEN